MKKLGIVMMFVALLAIPSCSTLSGATDTAAIASGTTCARALLALRASHKAGTLSVTNLSDISNMLVVANAYKQLRTNKDNANYKKSFSSGMVAGGSGIITNSNVATIVNLLMNANGLANVTSDNINTGNTATTTTHSIVPIVEGLK